MPIQILPARLANQIAAGEVVERPASVVKELIENSLDSGATQIDIEIEKGGHKRIVLRDNGSGIVKDELALALSRHATSKITCLDDLEAICSLGFRGEALASISSVARLTLSSKPKAQQQAWQAHCEGRDMQVEINPVAHPDGTSVDVADLFFNTPARRKFLKTEKTEFSHIDEVVRRIALSRFDVSFNLKHNGKLLRKYPAISEQGNPIKRVTAICSKEFAQQSIELNSQYQEFELKGWLVPPSDIQTNSEFQYFYVNGRVMRDKLINHAIRQAIENFSDVESSFSYVLYLTINADQVDVNVHPAKHEVRFHQARLVHDFIYRALADALKQYFEHEQATTNINVLEPVEPKHDYIQPLQSLQSTQDQDVYLAGAQISEPAARENQNGYSASTAPISNSADFSNRGRLAHTSSRPKITGAGVNTKSYQGYQDLMQASQGTASPVGVGNWLRCDDGKIIVGVEQNYYLLNVTDLHKAVLMKLYQKSLPVSQPLLMPVSIEANEEMLTQAKKLYQPLLENSVEIGWTPNRILLRKVPAGLRQFQWAECLSKILECDKISVDEVGEYLLSVVVKNSNITENNQIQDLWAQFVIQSSNLSDALKLLARPLPLNKWLSAAEKNND
ncbi:DNA mismatch repair endonuclease MutL [Paraglaciecola aquimarina]|uniref:DNA mismatch repair protein MutL n=1 Tax=Paraglaciecola algarum TaxID=3050085 RepID=A0ABS9D7U9_9ALTE|nr:DNA mismatch repair endonuclease MutL [Paraglaciecola sp. G1-23]MCF2949033.1 DNA mismatch repair endonuclease MutL [Paraglaciecola sp. G1-23]